MIPEQVRALELTTLNQEGSSRVYQTLNHSLRALLVGGAEGEKRFLDIILDRKERLLRLGFVVKEIISDSEEPNQVAETRDKLIQAYRELRHRGYPVPATARYFTEKDVPFLVTSDLTEGGQYWLWGYNDLPSPLEFQQLHEMNLSSDEIASVEAQIWQLAQKASADNFAFRFNYYHVRKHKLSGKIDIVLLDIDYYLLTNVASNSDNNSYDARLAVKFLNEARAKAADYL